MKRKILDIFSQQYTQNSSTESEIKAAANAVQQALLSEQPAPKRTGIASAALVFFGALAAIALFAVIYLDATRQTTPDYTGTVPTNTSVVFSGQEIVEKVRVAGIFGDYCLLEDRQSGAQKLYKVGDKVLGHAIVKIEEDRVTLNDSAGDFVLKLGKGDSAPQENTTPAELSNATIAGKVINTRQEPVANAAVRLLCKPDAQIAGMMGDWMQKEIGNAVTDEQGAFTLHYKNTSGSSEQTLTLDVSHTDYAPTQTKQFTHTVGEKKHDVIILHDGATVSGKVTDDNGNPIAGASVSALSPNLPAYITDLTDSDASAWTGRAGVPGGDEKGAKMGAIRIVAQRPSAGETPEIESVVPLRMPWESSTSTITDEKGEYVLKHVPAGQWNIKAKARNLLPAVQQVEVAAAEHKAGVNFSLAKAAVIRGKVISEHTGKGLAGCLVNAMSATTQPSVGSARTDESGEFEIPNLIPGEKYSLIASSDPDPKNTIYGMNHESLMGRLENVEANSSVTLVIPTPPQEEVVTISGVVISKKDRTPIELFQLKVKTTEENNVFFMVGSATPHKEGRFSRKFVKNKSYSLEFAAPNYAGKTFTFENLQADQEITVELGEGASINGVILDPAGKPLPNASVRLAKPQSQDAKPGHNVDFIAIVAEVDGSVGGGLMLPNQSVLTDADGKFTLTHIEPGTYVIRATHSKYSAQESSPIDITDNEQAVSGIEIRMKAGATVRGTVVDRSNLPVPSATVTCIGSKGGFKVFQCDTQGSFTFENAPAGAMQVIASYGTPDGFVEISSELTIPEEGDFHTTIKPTGVQFSGTLWIDGTQANSEYFVYFTSDSGKRHVGTTDSSGKFLIHNLQAGKYTVKVEQFLSGKMFEETSITMGTTDLTQAIKIKSVEK